jgi:hypothetical protein
MSFLMRMKMRCEECHGDRVVMRYSPELSRWHPVPCPSCNGTAITSCCEGQVGNSCDVTNLGTITENGMPQI